jgi:hypothetical protein
LQIGEVFTWDVPVTDVNATNPGTAAVTRALTVPSGVPVLPIVNWMVNNVTTASIALLVSDLAHTDTVPTATLCTLACGGAAANSRSTALVDCIKTNTARQVRTRLSASGASDVLVGVTIGWRDPRGA